MAFRFKDKERPRGYTSKVAGLLHVRPIYVCKGCFQGDALWQHACVALLIIGVPGYLQRHGQKRGCMLHREPDLNTSQDLHFSFQY